MTALWNISGENLSVARELTPMGTRYWSMAGAHFSEFNATLMTVGLYKRVPGLEQANRKVDLLLSAFMYISP